MCQKVILGGTFESNLGEALKVTVQSLFSVSASWDRQRRGPPQKLLDFCRELVGFFFCFFGICSTWSLSREMQSSGKSKWGLSKWGLKALVHNCPRLPTIVVILRRKFPLERGPKRPQKCTIVDDCAQIAESGLKLPFESPHLDFPEECRFCRISSGFVVDLSETASWTTFLGPLSRKSLFAHADFESLLPFVRIHSGNNSKIIFLCICICYEIKILKIIFKTIFIC